MRKLAEVMGEVDRVAKNGRNDHFNYDFATESDITAAVRKEMAARHLLLVPTVEKTDWEKVARRNGETKLCTLTVRYRLMDGDSGEEMEFTVLGQGEDSLDKATYKAMTGATKYALLKLFLIPTGDDPEKTTEHRFVPNKSAPPQEQSEPTDAAPLAPADPASDIVVPFGKSKGKKLSETSQSDLEWLVGAFTKSVAANDPKFHAKNVAQLAAAQAELARRSPPKEGKRAAPRQEASRAARDPLWAWREIAAFGEQYDMTEKEVGALLKQVSKKQRRGELTLDDVNAVKDAIEIGMGGRPREEPPFPGEER